MIQRIACVVLMVAATVYGQRKETKPAAPETPSIAFEIGKEVKVEDATLFDKHHVLYVPSDYTPDREWPVIFCYHGVNQAAKVWPFKELTDGKGYIVIGMSYLTERGGSTEEEWASMQKIYAAVSKSLKVNPKMLFIGGFSLGGGWTYRLSAKDPSVFAGIIALGMSGQPGATMPEAYKGKPVLIAHGENDEYTKNIQSTLDGYAKLGANVTHEVFKGQGHTVDTKNAVMKKWLLDNGPLSAVKMDFEKAQGLEKSGKVGAALAAYEAIVKVGAGNAYAKSAEDAAKAITEVADKKFAEAEEAVTAKKYPIAIKTLVALEKTYAGSSLAEKAKTRLVNIQSDPAIKAEIEQARIDTSADAMEAQAKSLERNKEFGRAIAIYERYVIEFTGARRFAEVKAHLETLKSDKTIQSGIAGKQIENDCKGWLAMAENYQRAGDNTKAKQFLQRIIDKYPGSTYATEARRRMQQLK